MTTPPLQFMVQIAEVGQELTTIRFYGPLPAHVVAAIEALAGPVQLEQILTSALIAETAKRDVGVVIEHRP